jgi:hypothetical protein
MKLGACRDRWNVGQHIPRSQFKDGTAAGGPAGPNREIVDSPVAQERSQ